MASSESTQPATRLMIQRMQMENFKSYLGVQEVGPFHQCFSSVVGPNGSGKSNVIDALLFVFGYRAKKIRQAKLKDLIHKSEGNTDIDFCRVSVFFSEIIDQDDGSFAVVPNSEFVVAREATSANQSNYYLNGKKKTFKEIGGLLRGKGIDLDHNRFLILQGEVESIAMMKPKAQNEHDDGLLEYLEDIIGSDQFKEPIASDEEKLTELNDARNEKLARVKAVEGEKNKLEDGKNEAEAYLAQENELTVLKSKLWQLYLHGCQSSMAEAQAQLDEVQASYQEQKAELDAKATEVKTKETSLKKEQAEVAKLQKACDKAKAEFTAFERRDIKHKEEKKFLKNKIKKLTAAVDKATATLHEQTSKDSSLQEDQQRWQQELEQAQADLATAEAELETMLQGLQEEMADKQGELTAAQQELAPYSQQRAEAQAALELKQNELALATKGARDLEQQQEAAKTGLTEAKATLKERQAQVKTLTKQQAKIETALASKQERHTELTAALAPLESDVTDKRVRLEEAKAASSSSRANSTVLTALKKYARAHNLTGFHGRLGDLGTIADRYDVAVTTACGALNNMVVATVAEAKACVEHLRKTGAGRATFIILEKIAGLQARAEAAFKGPDNVERLFDLITPDEEQFKVAFYFALRDTLVAKSLDQATQVAYQGSRVRYRVVTLKGELIDTSGTMSGGGKKVLRGGMSSAKTELSPEDLTVLERDMEKQVRQLTKLRNEQQALMAAISGLETELASTQGQLERCEMEMAALSDKSKALAQQLVDLEQRQAGAEADSERTAALEAEIKTLTKAVVKADSAASSYQQAVTEAEKALADVGGIRLKAQRAKVEDLTAAMTSLKAQITRGTVDGKAVSRKTQQLTKKIESNKAELEEAAAALEALRASFAEIEEGAEKVLEDFKQAELMLEERAEVVAQHKREHEDALDALSQLKSSMVDVEHRVQEYTRSLKDNTVKAKHWKNKLSKLQLHTIGQDDDDDEEEEAAEPDTKSSETTDDMDQQADAATEDQGEVPAKRAKQTLPELDEQALAALNEDTLNYDIAVLEEQLNGHKPNMSVIEQFYKKEQDYLARVAELDSVTAERDQVRTHYEDLRKQRLDMFMAGFSTITNKLKEMYQMITLGGDAELELVDRLNPFSEGIVFSVRPPKKSWKNISNLSGGEKTLSSLALVFALHHFKPTPLYVMDEIDAALDFKNVSIVANYIKERTKNAQFIIISLRNNMFELADRLIGIYKTDNATKSVTINPALVAAQAAQRSQGQQASKAASVAGAVPLATAPVSMEA